MWKNITGQVRVKEILKNIFRSEKISHAYIFYGNDGVGKDAAAVEFAKLLNCENPADGTEACDKCRSCIEIDSFKSPLVKFITALPSGKNESDDDSNPLEKLEKEDFANYLAEIEAKTFDKYHKIFLPRANDIRIPSIRQIKREIYLTGKAGKKKVFIISNCDRMNPQSANSLLKILEEPPKDSVLILTTSKINSLLPTIVGRCQKIKFDSISRTDIIKYINGKDDKITRLNAEFFAGLSEGSIAKVNEILDYNYLELREKVLDLLTSLITNQYMKLGNDIDFIIGKKDKERIKQFLILLIIWFRDIINKTYGNEELIINKDKAERLSKFVSNFNSQNYKIINSIEEAIKDVESNIFPDLLLYNLSYKIKSYIQRKS
jgi:DNA polymerase III subunit delta'